MDHSLRNIPSHIPALEAESKRLGFEMSSDLQVGSLLKTLVTTKPQANILELGTGIGLSLSWMIDGMDANSIITSVDNNAQLCDIVRSFYQADTRVNILCQDGADFICSHSEEKFDIIFADAWPGKYELLEETLSLVNEGGCYVVDDMKEQPDWPVGHSNKADHLMEQLLNRDDFNMTSLDWSSGVVVLAKKKNANG